MQERKKEKQKPVEKKPNPAKVQTKPRPATEGAEVRPVHQVPVTGTRVPTL